MINYATGKRILKNKVSEQIRDEGNNENNRFDKKSIKEKTIIKWEWI